MSKTGLLGLLGGILLLGHGCLIEDDNIRPETLPLGCFSSCVIEDISDSLEIRHILLCNVEDTKATFTYIYKSKKLLQIDTISLSMGGDTLETYVSGRYLYDDRYPIKKSFGVSEYKDVLVEMNNKYKDSADSVILYNDIPCKKKMFDDMYETYINN